MRAMRTALAERRLNRRWTRSHHATHSPPRLARIERKSSASRAQLPAAPYTADTRCCWNTPRRLLRKFQSCNADKCERPRLTSQFKRLTINETMPQRNGKAHRSDLDWKETCPLRPEEDGTERPPPKRVADVRFNFVDAARFLGGQLFVSL